MAGSESTKERAEKRVGSRLLGKWRLDRVLGSGGMATVYAATHRNKNRVAIKMLHPEIALDGEVQARFLREGYLANSVDHPGTVRVLDDDVTEDGIPFLVMELLDGETLEGRWLRKGQQLPVSEALSVVNQLLDVLEAAHARGIVHRDLKPENLFLTRNGGLKVLDFGIARLREISKDGQSTTMGMVLGTPAFMAPEQARARWDEVDARTDLWAVGATLFTLISGAYVHEAETINEQLIAAATIPARSVAEVAPGLAPEIVALVDRALAFDKAERFADAASMRTALRAALGNLPDTPLSLPSPSIVPGTTADTMRAPEEVTAAITGKRQQTTGRPLAWDPEPTSRSRARWQLWAAGGVAAVAVVVGLLSWPQPAAPGTLSSGAFEPVALATRDRVEAMASLAALNETEASRPADPPSDEPRVEPAAAPKPPPSAPLPRIEPKLPEPAPVARPAPAPVAPPKPAPDPFDRRK